MKKSLPTGHERILTTVRPASDLPLFFLNLSLILILLRKADIRHLILTEWPKKECDSPDMIPVPLFVTKFTRKWTARRGGAGPVNHRQWSIRNGRDPI